MSSNEPKFAVYDLSFLRFLSPTYSTRKDAEAVAKAGTNLEVREV